MFTIDVIFEYLQSVVVESIHAETMGAENQLWSVILGIRRYNQIEMGVICLIMISQ
jgi:hypothetical protein